LTFPPEGYSGFATVRHFDVDVEPWGAVVARGRRALPVCRGLRSSVLTTGRGRHRRRRSGGWLKASNSTDRRDREGGVLRARSHRRRSDQCGVLGSCREACTPSAPATPTHHFRSAPPAPIQQERIASDPRGGMAQQRRTSKTHTPRPRYSATTDSHRRNRTRQRRTAGPYLVAAFALFMAVVGGLFWLLATPGAFGRNGLEPDYPIQEPPTSTRPAVTVSKPSVSPNSDRSN